MFLIKALLKKEIEKNTKPFCAFHTEKTLFFSFAIIKCRTFLFKEQLNYLQQRARCCYSKHGNFLINFVSNVK